MKRLAEEHEARLQAESSCQDHVQRLAVHAEQVSEYAQQKATDLTEICKQVGFPLTFVFSAFAEACGAHGRPAVAGRIIESTCYHA